MRHVCIMVCTTVYGWMDVVCMFARTAQGEPVSVLFIVIFVLKSPGCGAPCPTLLCHLLFPRSLRDRGLGLGSLTLTRLCQLSA